MMVLTDWRVLEMSIQIMSTPEHVRTLLREGGDDFTYIAVDEKYPLGLSLDGPSLT